MASGSQSMVKVPTMPIRTSPLTQSVSASTFTSPWSLIAREADHSKSCVLTVGNFAAGSAPNIIPNTAILQGTQRTNDSASREKLARRLKEAAQRPRRCMAVQQRWR